MINVRFRGAYIKTDDYEPGDVVYSNDALYMCVGCSQDNTPPLDNGLFVMVTTTNNMKEVY